MIKDIIARLKTINQANGFLANVTDVKETETLDGLRPRGLAVYQVDDSWNVLVNAETVTLAQLQLDIAAVLSSAYYVIRKGNALVVTPIIKPKRLRTKNKESGDATIETT